MTIRDFLDADFDVNTYVGLYAIDPMDSTRDCWYRLGEPTWFGFADQDFISKLPDDVMDRRICYMATAVKKSNQDFIQLIEYLVIEYVAVEGV